MEIRQRDDPELLNFKNKDKNDTEVKGPNISITKLFPLLCGNFGKFGDSFWGTAPLLLCHTIAY